MTTPTDDDSVRQDERERIAKYMERAANSILRDPESDAIDGYVAAVMLDIAAVIQANGGADL